MGRQTERQTDSFIKLLSLFCQLLLVQKWKKIETQLRWGASSGRIIIADRDCETTAGRRGPQANFLDTSRRINRRKIPRRLRPPEKWQLGLLSCVPLTLRGRPWCRCHVWKLSAQRGGRNRRGEDCKRDERERASAFLRWCAAARRPQRRRGSSDAPGAHDDAENERRRRR